MSAVSRKSQAIIDASRWPMSGQIMPNDKVWHDSLLARFSTDPDDAILWFRTYDRPSMHTADTDALEDEARFVHMHLRASALSHAGYMQFGSPQAFFNDFGITVRLTRQGHEAANALKLGMVWDLLDRTTTQAGTHNHWVHRARCEQNPMSALFQSIPSPTVHPLFEKVRKLVEQSHVEVWQKRIAAMDSPYAHDWYNIVNANEPYLADVRKEALDRHNQAWIDTLQQAKTADDKIFAAIAKLPDAWYRDAKNEAMLVKMRVWAPLDQNGRRMKVG